MREERWMAVPGYEGLYEVSRHGIIRSTGRSRTNYTAAPRDLRPAKRKNGYLQVILYRDGGDRSHYVHRVVAEAFLSNPKKLPAVNHIDANRSNNAVTNLEWVTDAQNKTHAKGLENYGRKLRAPQVAIIKARLRAGENCYSLADEYDVTVMAINAIKHGRNWKHVAAATSEEPSPPH